MPGHESIVDYYYNELTNVIGNIKLTATKVFM